MNIFVWEAYTATSCFVTGIGDFTICSYKKPGSWDIVFNGNSPARKSYELVVDSARLPTYSLGGHINLKQYAVTKCPVVLWSHLQPFDGMCLGQCMRGSAEVRAQSQAELFASLEAALGMPGTYLS